MSSDFAFSELTPVSFLRRAAAVFGDRTAIVDGDFAPTAISGCARVSPPTCLHRPVSSRRSVPSWLRTRICCSRHITACRSAVVFWWH
jgi:hypothetical protein